MFSATVTAFIALYICLTLAPMTGGGGKERRG